jgi:lipopolysaccharide transport system ATP-binding protein
MSRPAIEVSGLGKHYVIRHESRHDNLRDTLHHTARKLWRRFRWGTGFATEDFWALRDVSFSIQPGEVVGIIGRNGAGKSTLLKILSRITEPTRGRVTLRGRVASLLEVGTGFHPDLSGRENIFLNGAILGMSRVEIRAKFDEIVAFAEVEKFIDTPVKHYSSGMYVRLAFAVAAHLEPEILIVDEVLAVGDVQFQQKCLGKMQDVARRTGRTILFVSHNLKAVETLCTRGIILQAGHVLVDEISRQAVARYLELTRNDTGGAGERDLCDELRLLRMEFSPNPCPVGGRVRFTLTLLARVACELQDVSILLYTTHGDRAAILDLRESAAPRRLAEGGTVEFHGEVPALNVVEGRYECGLYLRTAREFFDALRLAALHVEPAPSASGLTAYAPEYQGVAVLPFVFSSRLAPARP